MAGADSDEAVAISGELAGREAAHALGHGDEHSDQRITEIRAQLSDQPAADLVRGARR